MSDKPNDGGPAFPVITEGRDPWGKLTIDPRSPGMTLRDWFAGQAMAYMGDGYSHWHLLAEDAYALADAMLIERDKPDPAA